VKRSDPAFFNEIATHLSGARNDRLGKGFRFLNRDLGYFKNCLDGSLAGVPVIGKVYRKDGTRREVRIVVIPMRNQMILNPAKVI
jgi:hypothetical protein